MKKVLRNFSILCLYSLICIVFVLAIANGFIIDNEITRTISLFLAVGFVILLNYNLINLASDVYEDLKYHKEKKLRK